MGNDYAQKLKDPRWQRKRLEILERDNWCCQQCGDGATTLHVHHRYYRWDADPWDYPDEVLVTLCEECHRDEKDDMKAAERRLSRALRTHFLAADIDELAGGFEDLAEVGRTPDVVASALSATVQDPDALQALVDAYFRRVRGERGAGG